MSHPDTPPQHLLDKLTSERPNYPDALSTTDLQPGLKIRRYWHLWSSHHERLRLIQSDLQTVTSEVTVDDGSERYLSYLLPGGNVAEFYDHTVYRRKQWHLADLGLEAHRTPWGLFWEKSSFCTLATVARITTDEPRPVHEDAINLEDLQPGVWIRTHGRYSRSALFRVMSAPRLSAEPLGSDSYGGLTVELYDDELKDTTNRAPEDLGLLPYRNPNGDRWADVYCTLASPSRRS